MARQWRRRRRHSAREQTDVKAAGRRAPILQDSFPLLYAQHGERGRAGAVWKHVWRRQRSQAGIARYFYEAPGPPPPPWPPETARLSPRPPPACSAWGQGGLHNNPPPVTDRPLVSQRESLTAVHCPGHVWKWPVCPQRRAVSGADHKTNHAQLSFLTMLSKNCVQLSLSGESVRICHSSFSFLMQVAPVLHHEYDGNAVRQKRRGQSAH